MTRASNRRAFLARSAAVTAASVAGPAVLGAPASATTTAGRTSPVDVAVRPEALRDPVEATLAEAVTLVRRGRLSAVDLVQAHLDRISAVDGTLKAWNAVVGDAALAAARKVRRGDRRLLAGAPLCIKDNYFTRGVPTTANSYLFEDFVPTYDATAVARLRQAGGIVLGKGQMGPLATTRATLPNGTVTTVNPWTPQDPSTDPGGSSTGPACAVAARMASSSIGTQTGGSIVLPANRQNMTGLKPTMGRVSLHGVIPLSFTRDHVGPIARDALDAALMLTAMAGADAQDPRTQGLPRVPDLVRAATPVTVRGRVQVRRSTRVGVPADFLATAPPAQLAARRAFLDTLSAVRGVRLVDVVYPDDWALLTTGFNVGRLPERSEPFRPYLQDDLRGFGVSVLSWLQGLMLSGDEWATAQRAKTHLLGEVLDGFLGDVDVVLQTDVVPFDLLGLPELGLPIGFTTPTPTTPALPVGAILGAGPYEEDRLLELAAAYQASTDWHLRRPPEPAAASTRSRRVPPDALALTAEEVAAVTA
ncbi:amidase [Solicola sp. PLA-1-18]|uniref:amidase n=1 Tax=Solicola sp. PLA-1-18 TaxID=3380532 RepID=UPI003B7698CA